MEQVQLSQPAPFVLASIAASYPDEGYAESMRMVMEDGEVSLPESLRSKILERLKSDELLDGLRSEYIEIFDTGRGSNPLYETEYGRDRAMFKANELADLSGFYKAFGFERQDDPAARDMIDHVAIELEFYALLVMKQHALEEGGNKEGSEIVLDARKKFLDAHLGRYLDALCRRPGIEGHNYYSEIFAWCRDLVNEECRLLGVAPRLTTWLSSQVEGEEITCGGRTGACLPT